MEKKLRPRCYFDIDIGHSRAGRIIFELFDDLCPKTTDNFAKLCTGECGIGETTKNKLHYLNTNFHRVIKGFMIQGGDFSSGDGTGGESIYGGRFEDENLETRHDEPYLLSMANCGPNTNGSQFFIITNPAPHLDKKHVVFGRVLSGENLIESIENLPVNNNKPVVDATIAACGVLIPVRKKKTKKDKENCCKSSSEKDKKNKKSKKRKHKSKKKTKTADCNLEEINPNCSVRPDEIPEVPKPFFLYRGRLKDDMKCKGDETYRENSVEQVHKKYLSKDAVGRSGRIIKGRGQLKYLSRSRSETPPHWKKQSQRDDRNNELINQFQNEHDNHERKRTLSKSSSDIYFKKSIFNSETQDRLTRGKEDEIPRKKKKSDLVLDYKTITEISPLVNTSNKRNDFKVSKLESVKRDFDKTKRRGSNNSMEQNCMNKDRMESYDSVKITEYSKKKANETDDHVKKRSSNAIKNKDDSHKLVHVRDYNVNTQKSNDSAYIRRDQIRNQSNDSIQRKQVYDFEQKKDDLKEKSNDSMKIKNKHDKQDGDLYKIIDSDRIKDGTLRKELIINVKDTSLKNDKIDNKHAKGRNATKSNNKQLNLSEIEHDSQNVNDQFRKKPMLIDYVHRSTSSDHHVYNSKGKSSKEKELQKKTVKSDSSKKIEKSYFNKHEKIIYDYGDESDDSLRQRRNERKHGSKILPGKERNKDDEFKKSVETSDKNLKDYSQKYNSKSKSHEKRNTRSPPAHLVAKWQNRRDIIMTRRSPIARTLNRSRYSPRRYSPRYSTSPPRNEKYVSSHRSPLYKEKVTSSKHGKLSKFKRSRSSSGTIDSSPSSDGSSLITDNNRQSSDIIKQDQKTEVVDSTKTVEKNKLTKEAEVQVVLASKEKSIEPVMVIKPIEKPKILSQWKTEEDDSDEKKQQSSILAKLRESDDKKQKSVIVSQKVVSEVQLPKIHSPPISQSISKYRSPSGSRDKQSSSRSSRLSSRSSSRSKRRHRSESSHYRSRGLRYHRGGASRRSTSRSRRARHYSRSHSRSYSSSSSVSPSRRHYSSRSRSNSSHYDRRRRRQSFRGKGFLSRPYERK